jgi:hypothetical protein
VVSTPPESLGHGLPEQHVMHSDLVVRLKTAFDLHSSSMFVASLVDARFLMLMMAIGFQRLNEPIQPHGLFVRRPQEHSLGIRQCRGQLAPVRITQQDWDDSLVQHDRLVEFLLALLRIQRAGLIAKMNALHASTPRFTRSRHSAPTRMSSTSTHT